ncbi:hypothetical protein Tel_16020 [Candidatus Tenderia electrophaga]|jgi:hypothetical protein|uniref:Ava_C0101 and related proteins n=1 Tax=Candidatus Tenderia electrophaga TaxID=1748243 RepID=A0A0S2THB1_9GAMM|nr:hypothetical protein Tel_16020 [Candidatus Tenderia electrophaga]
MAQANRSISNDWPELPFAAWRDTCATLHLWTQIVGKIRLAQTPWINHSWHVPLYVSGRGLSTSPIPYGGSAFQIDFDFIDHALLIHSSDCLSRRVPLRPQSVADFYRALMATLGELGLDIRINPMPNEIPDAIRFDQDTTHDHYDAESVTRFWRALVQVDRVFKEFRARFLGKCSPVHFFWGSFDLAVTRFSGRPAPPHPGGFPNMPDWVAREAYSHEVSSAGFWPGGGGIDHAAFYSYAYPTPNGFAEAPVRPSAAYFSKQLGEFILPYDDVRQAASPDELLLGFLQSSYAAAADLAQWDRDALERDMVDVATP